MHVDIIHIVGGGCQCHYPGRWTSAPNLASEPSRSIEHAALDPTASRVRDNRASRAPSRLWDLWQMASGPFGKYQQQPIIQALIFAAAGLGISFIEPMFQFFEA